MIDYRIFTLGGCDICFNNFIFQNYSCGIIEKHSVFKLILATHALNKKKSQLKSYDSSCDF